MLSSLSKDLQEKKYGDFETLKIRKIKSFLTVQFNEPQVKVSSRIKVGPCQINEPP